MELPDHTIKTFEQKFKDTTIKNIKASMKRIFLNVFELDEFDIKILVKEREKVFNYITDQTITSQKTLISHYLNVIETYKINEIIYNEIKEVYQSIVKYVDQKRGYIKPTQDELNNKITLEEINKIRLKFQKKLTDTYDHYNDQAYMLLSLYYYLPPLRSQDYLTTYITRRSNNPYVYSNCIDLEKKEWKIRKYKTDAYHGDRTIPIPDELYIILKNYLKKKKYPLLLSKLSNLDEPISTQYFNYYNKNIFRRDISTSELRKSYVSNLGDIPYKERELIAFRMGHTLTTQLRTYSKYSKNITESNI